MREIALRLALTRRLVATVIAAAAVLTAVAGLGAPSALAAGSVKVTTSYVQTPISANKADSILFAISNSTGSTVNNLTFSDTLPVGTTLGDPVGVAIIPGASSTCGSVTAVNPASGAASAPGDVAFAITVSTVPSAASGAICSVSLGIVSVTPSVADAPYFDALSSTFTTPKPVLTSAGIVVLNDPALTVVKPKKGETFKLGQIVAANFGCSATDPLDTIASVFATDEYSNQVNTGEAIDTVDPGKNTLQFNCYSGIGSGDTTQSMTYKVSSYTVASVKENASNGEVTFKSLVPAGKFVAEILHGKQVIGAAKATVHYRHTATVSVKLKPAGAKLLSKAKGKPVKVTLSLAFTPSGVGIGPDRIAASGPIDVTKAISVEMKG
jgi:hypothetical protein